MKYFQLEGIINEELLNNFFHFLNTNPDECYTIVINSVGGKSTLSYFLLDVINQQQEKFTLVNTGAYSAAFFIFYFARCKKKLVHGSLGMYHKEYLRDISISSDKQTRYNEDTCQYKNLNCIDEKFVQDFMNKKELGLFNRSEDVFFTFERMKQIFPNAEIVHR
jgi:hypothetical protein